MSSTIQRSRLELASHGFLLLTSPEIVYNDVPGQHYPVSTVAFIRYLCSPLRRLRSLLL